MFSFSVNELPCDRRVCEFQSFSSQVRKSWPLSFQSYPSRQSQCAPDVSGCVNPGQAVVSPVHFVNALVMERRAVLADCMAVSAEQQKFLNKKIWSSLNHGGQISVFHLWEPVPNSRTANFVLKPQRNNWHAPTFFFPKLHTNLKH